MRNKYDVGWTINTMDDEEETGVYYAENRDELWSWCKNFLLDAERDHATSVMLTIVPIKEENVI